MPKAIDHARDSILSATRSLVAREGYESLNMRTIACASGIGTGTVYNYFGAKDEIVFALMTEDWNRTLESMDSALDAKLDSGFVSAEARAGCLESIFTPLKEFIHTYKGIWIILAGSPPGEKSPSVRHYDKALFMEELAQRIQRVWAPAGGNRDDFTVSFVCRSLSTYAQEGDFDFKELAKILGRLMETKE